MSNQNFAEPSKSGVLGTVGLRHHCANLAQKTAIIAGDTLLTYLDLYERASRLAVGLLDRGAGPEQPVATVLSNGIEVFEIAMAASMIDAPYLPLNWHLKASELAFLLDDSGARVVVCGDEFIDQVNKALLELSHSVALIETGNGGAYEQILSHEKVDTSLDPGAGPELVFYTSGTTARPKGVVHAGLGSVKARAAGMQAQVALWNWSPDDVYVMSGPAYHAAHAGWGLTSLFVGATMVLPPRFDAQGFLRTIEQYRGTRSFMVPSHFIRILELPTLDTQALDMSSFKLVVHGGAPCPLRVKRSIMELLPSTEFYELYGASEGGATRISPSEWLEHPGSVGRAWPGVEIKILTDQGEPVKEGVDGVIWIKPPANQRFTYRNSPEASNEAWHDGAFSVGDIGHLDADGYLYITDRVSDMVLWGGVNISPREIEEVLFEHEAVVDCAVFGIPDERDGEHLMAIVELSQAQSSQAQSKSDESSMIIEKLKGHVREHLADYKVPHVWKVVAELPRDPNGKVMKRLLRLQALEDLEFE